MPTVFWVICQWLLYLAGAGFPPEQVLSLPSVGASAGIPWLQCNWQLSESKLINKKMIMLQRTLHYSFKVFVNIILLIITIAQGKINIVGYLTSVIFWRTFFSPSCYCLIMLWNLGSNFHTGYLDIIWYADVKFPWISKVAFIFILDVIPKLLWNSFQRAESGITSKRLGYFYPRIETFWMAWCSLNYWFMMW